MSQQKIVLVTGGNNGIGFETCAQLAAESNTHVVMGSRSTEKGEKAVAAIKARVPSASLTLVQLDITSDESIDSAVATVTSKFGRLDTLINNAGICPTEVSRDLLRSTLDTNTSSPALVTQAFLPLLKKTASASGGARLVYVSSRLGSLGQRSSPDDMAYNEDYKVYRMSKAALNMLALCDAWQYKKDGIKVFSYCPGYVVTDLAGMRDAKTKQGAPGPEKSAEGLVAIHRGERDEQASQFLSSGSDADVAPVLPW